MASATDIEESWQLGLKGVGSGHWEGKSGEMDPLCCRISDEPYQVIYDGADVQQIANAEKKIPTAWINEAGNDVTEEMVRYLRPLTVHGRMIGCAGARQYAALSVFGRSALKHFWSGKIWLSIHDT